MRVKLSLKIWSVPHTVSDPTMRLTAPQHVCLVLTVLVAHGLHAVECFQADSGSRGSREDTTDESKERTFFPLGVIALWKLRPLWKTFSGGFNGYGSFGGTFGGGGNYYYPGGQGYYPFAPTAGFAGAGAGAGAGGFAGSGFNQAFFPGGIHPIGYPYPVVGGPGQSTAANKRGQRPTVIPTQNTFVEDASRFDVAEEENEVTTTRPGLVQSLQEFTSPLFHSGQKVEARASNKNKYQFSPSSRRQPRDN